MATLYKRGKTWWLRWYADGKRQYRSLKTSSKKTAERELHALEAELLEPHRRAPRNENPKIEDFWTAYEEWALEHKRASSHLRVTQFWDQLIEHTGAKRVRDIKREHIESFKAWRRAEGNADQTINNAIKDIRAVFNRAAKLGVYTGPNPTEGVERFRIPRKMPTFHTEEEMLRLLREARKQGQYTEWVVLLCGWAGLRRNEVVNVRWEWFDFNKKKPTIHVKSFEGFAIKDYEERVIPMSKRIREALHPHRQAEGYLFESNRATAGKWKYRYEPSRGLRKALKAAQLSTADPFQKLRRSFGSNHLLKGKSIAIISRWLGHSSVRVTERHYAGILAYDEDIDAF